MKTIWKNKIVDVEIYLDLENSLDGTATILSNKNVLGEAAILHLIPTNMQNLCISLNYRRFLLTKRLLFLPCLIHGMEILTRKQLSGR